MNKNIKRKKNFNISIKNVTKVNLNKGDCLLITIDFVISNEQREHLKNHMQEYFPNNNILIVTKGYQFSIIADESDGTTI